MERVPDVKRASGKQPQITKPCRSGQTGMRPFGSLGPAVDLARYEEQLAEKVAEVRASLLEAVPSANLASAEVFASPAHGHRHRAGPFVILGKAGGDEAELRESDAFLELAMWDPVAKGHSIVRAEELHIYSPAIAAAMESFRRLPILIDAASDDSARENAQQEGQTHWGRVVGQGLRSVQFHSTLSGELLVCLAYFDERLQRLKRGERLSGEKEGSDEVEVGGMAWTEAAQPLRAALLEVLPSAGSPGGDAAARVSVVGRWKRRRLVVGSDFVTERMRLPNGRMLVYKQPEGQFSNPNAPCEVSCLAWLCQEAAQIRREALAEDVSARVNLLELYCGGGCNTVALAPSFDEVTAVEINRTLAAAAEENLKANGVTNVRMLRLPSAEAKAHASGAAVVLVDPPRAGLDAVTRDLVATFAHVLYISCNPDALARDLLELCDHEVCSVAIFDMFPYTTHVECAVRLQRRSPMKSN